MSRELSKIRLYAMQLVYLLTGIGLGIQVWPVMINRAKPWDPLHGIAYSFWAAYSVLMLLGVRFPVRMLPLLLLQFFYKVTWLIAVGYPLWKAGPLSPVATELFKACGIAAVLDLIVIPWPYVFENYAKAMFKPAAQHKSLSPEFVPPVAK